MSDVRDREAWSASDLIRRARWLAALADDATPGPWHDVPGEILAGEYSVVGCACGESGCGVRGRSGSEEVANHALIAAAPDMAALLRQLADALEAAYTWMHNWHDQHCSEVHHAPNCPVSDLRLNCLNIQRGDSNETEHS